MLRSVIVTEGMNWIRVCTMGWTSPNSLCNWNSKGKLNFYHIFPFNLIHKILVHNGTRALDMYNTIFMSKWRDGVGVRVWTNYNVHLCLQTTLTLTTMHIFWTFKDGYFKVGEGKVQGQWRVRFVIQLCIILFKNSSITIIEYYIN